MKLQFSKTYFISFIIVLIIEASIALCISSGFIRSTFGDFLVVILIYCFIKSIVNAKPIPVAIGVLIFAFAIEFLQLFKLLEFLNLQSNKLANILLGNTFQISDLISYTLGVATILILEYKIRP
ncbi:DUF2809 domain-containing protein [Flavobacteriaceae bacterium LMO-SS05]